MKEHESSASASKDAQLRAFIDAAWPMSPLDDGRLRRWRAAGRTLLLLLLAFSFLQYYFFDVHLTIMALPSVTHSVHTFSVR